MVTQNCSKLLQVSYRTPVDIHVNTLEPFFFIICLNYILIKALDQIYDLGFTLIKKKTKPHNAINIIEIYYVGESLRLPTPK